MSKLYLGGDANLTAMNRELQRTMAQVELLNSRLADMNNLSQGTVNPKGYRNMQSQLAGVQKNTVDAALSTGLFHHQQVSLNSVTDDYLKSLQKGKVTFRQYRAAQKGVSQETYRQQRAMEGIITLNREGTAGGKALADVFTPKVFARSTNTISEFRKQLGFASHELGALSRGITDFGKNTQWVGRQLMVGMTLPLAAFGAAAGVMAYGVDKELVRIQKVYDVSADQTNKTAEGQMSVERELAHVREQSLKTAAYNARELGIAYKETLAIQADLAATGKTGRDLQEATNEVMRIATLGEMDYQTALKTSISLQSVFKQSTAELADSFNYMNAVENATSLQLADFSEAIPIAAAPIRAMGGDIRDLGVLLTAMKERGIEATQGANAIKSSMSRILRPSRQIRAEFEALTGASISNIVSDSGGDLVEIFRAVGRVTSALSDVDRNRVYAGLFGTYQVTRMSAMVDGLGDLEQGIGQVSDAYRLANLSQAELAENAEDEINRQMNSLSGRFNRGLQSFLGSVSEMGKPFLEIAIFAMDVLGGLIDKFNSLPDFGKKIISWVAIGAAAAGPLIMLIGLGLNLVGVFGSVVAAVGKFAGAMKLTTIAEKAQDVQGTLTSAGFSTMATQADILADAVHGIKRSFDEALKSQRVYGKYATINYGDPHMTTNKSVQDLFSRTSPTGEKGRIRSHESRWKESLALYNKQAIEHAHEAAILEDKARGSLKQQVPIREKINGLSLGQTLYAASMVTSLATMVFSSNHIADNIAKWTMGITMFLPLINKANLAIYAGVKRLRAMEFTATAGAAAQTTMFARMRSQIAGIAGPRGALMGMLRFIGPVGLIVGGLTAAFVITRKIKKAQEEEVKRLAKINSSYRELLSHARAYGKEVGDEGKAYNTNLGSSGPATVSETKVQEELANWKSDEMRMEDVSNQVKRSAEFRAAVVRQMIIDMRLMGASVEDIEVKMRSFLQATGSNALEAEHKWIILRDELLDGPEGSLKWSEVVDAEVAAINAAFDNAPKAMNFGQIENSMTRFGEVLSAMLGDPNTTAAEVQHLLDEQANLVKEGYVMLLSEIGDISAVDASNNNMALNIAELLGFSESSMEEIKNLLSGSTEELTNFVLGKIRDSGGQVTSDTANKVFAMMEKLQEMAVDAESKIATHIAGENGIAGSFDTLTEVVLGGGAALAQYMLIMGDGVDQFIQEANDAEAAIQRLESQKLALEQKKSATTNPFALAVINEELKLVDDGLMGARNELGEFINVANTRFGFAAGADITEGLWNLRNKTSATTDYMVNEAVRTKAAFDDIFNISREGDGNAGLGPEAWASTAKDAMRAAQQQMADDEKEAFKKRSTAALDALSKYWDDRLEAFDEATKKEQKRFDDLWDAKEEREKKYFDNKMDSLQAEIDAEREAEELRKKIFEAERTRMQRRAQMANQNIDFNVSLSTGNFDEAAKLQNNMRATLSDWALADADDAADDSSKERIKQLDDEIDKLDDLKDKRMKDLDDEREAAQENFDKIKEAEKKSLDERSKNAQAAAKQRWDAEEKALDRTLAAFLSYTATNKSDLKRHIGTIEGEYGNFRTMMKSKNGDWSESVQGAFEDSLRSSVNAIKSDQMWAEAGDSSAKLFIESAMGMTEKQFWEWMRGGPLPANAGIGIGNSAKGGGPSFKTTGSAHHKQTASARHTGGWVDGSQGSRKGVARTYNGVHPSEQMILARKNEFVVNESAAKANAGLLESINSNRGNIGNGVGGFGGMGGLLLSGMGGVFRTMMQTALLQGATRRFMEQESESFGTFSAASKGKYGSRVFGNEQLSNASIISNVGKSMGMSNRDIQIAIMTAITESGLKNIDYGDRDSLGLFQQRPSQGWGSKSQILDPQYSSKKFFDALKRIKNRPDRLPWFLAQDVQRSYATGGPGRPAYGSNFQKYWDEAQAIFAGMGKNTSIVGGSTSKAGWARPSVPGKGWSNSHDYRNGLNSPLYAHSNGVVMDSRAVTKGGSPGNGKYPIPYRSYGETVAIRGADGKVLRYAHLAPHSRMVNAGQSVKAGQLIGLSGNTGNSTGPHTHFDVNGNYNAKGYLASKGISLRKGAESIRWDNTLANLHHGEAVLTKDISSKFREGVDNFAEGPTSTYNVTVNAGTNANADEIAKLVVKEIKRQERRKPRGTSS